MAIAIAAAGLGLAANAILLLPGSGPISPIDVGTIGGSVLATRSTNVTTPTFAATARAAVVQEQAGTLVGPRLFFPTAVMREVVRCRSDLNERE